MQVSLVAPRLINKRIPEGSSFTVSASFFTDTTDVWTATTPTSIKYRIDRINRDPACSAVVLDWTTISPATTASIAITGAQNAINNGYASEEKRQILVRLNDGLSTQTDQAFQYYVTNLPGIS